MPSKKTALTNKASACFNAPILALFMPPLPSPALHATLLPVCSHLLSAGSGSSAPSGGYSAPHTCEQGDSMGISWKRRAWSQGLRQKRGHSKAQNLSVEFMTSPRQFCRMCSTKRLISEGWEGYAWHSRDFISWDKDFTSLKMSHVPRVWITWYQLNFPKGTTSPTISSPH